MNKINNLKYIILLAVGFLWCSLSYLSQELMLLKIYNETITNSVVMLYDSFAMAIGIILFMISFKKGLNVKKIYLIFLSISLILNIMSYIFNIGQMVILISIIMCLIGSAGYGVAYHFTLVSSKVKKDNRGIVFATGYGLGAFLTYLVSIIPNNFILSPRLLIIVIPLILINIYYIAKSEKFNDLKKEYSLTGLEKKKIILLISLVLIMSIITSISSNMFAIINYNEETGFAYSRIYYAIGLLIAGYIVDRNNKIFDILTIASLLFPLLSIILLKEQININLLANLNYFFLSFFVVYRTLSFMNITGKHKIYLSALGLCICRIIEGTLVVVNIYIEFSYLFLVISIIIFFSLMIGVYFYLHSLNYVNKEDVFQDFCVKYKLSIQEKKILNLLIQDYSNQEIADTLVLSINTVRNHVAHIYKKCDMKKPKIKENIVKKTI